MSFILDALRKSELDRQRQTVPGIAEFPIVQPDRRLPVALVAIGALLLLNIGIVLFFVLRDAPAPEAQAAPVPALAAAPPSLTTGPRTPSTEMNEPPAAGYAPGEELAEIPVEAYGEPATLPPDAPDPTLLPESHAPGVTYAEELPAPIDTLPPQDTAGLPELTVDLHIYAEDPAKRAVFINGRRYTQGAQIAEGPVVEEITREGAVLRHRGRRFLLPRL